VTSRRTINTTWLGLVGPGVKHLGVTGKAWSDHTDIRPTMMALLGLTDDYTYDGVAADRLPEPEQAAAVGARGASGMGGAGRHVQAAQRLGGYVRHRDAEDRDGGDRVDLDRRTRRTCRPTRSSRSSASSATRWQERSTS